MADSVVLTPEEQRRLRPLFSQYDLEDSSIVLGERVRPLMEKSGLPPQQLSQIWQLVDVENRGFLDFHGFAKCMRLIAHAQQGLALSPKMANIPSGMPDFSRQPKAASPTTAANVPPPPPQTHRGVPLAHTPSGNQVGGGGVAAFSTGSSITSANGETRIPPLTSTDKKRYGALFDRSVAPGDDFIDGNAARDIFLKARLPEDTLGRVWALVDVDSRGKLTKNEFVVALHLIQSHMTKTMPNLPSALPAAWQPWLGLARGPTGQLARRGSIQLSSLQSQQSPQLTGLRSPQMTSASIFSPQQPKPTGFASAFAAGSGAQHQHRSSTGTASFMAANNAANGIISPEERVQYDAIFDSLDPGKTGILGPNEAVPLLTKSGLSEDVLAKVWDLADTQSRGQLDKGDFAIAMHFVKAKLNGQELPDSLSAAKAQAFHQPPQQQQQQQQLHHARSSPQLSGTTAFTRSQQPPQPAQQQPPQPQTKAASPPPQSSVSPELPTSGSLSDLVSLDNAVFKPLEPVKPRRAQTEVDEKKFVPTTSFGRQLLEKRQAQAAHAPQQQQQPPKQLSTPQQKPSTVQQQVAAQQPAIQAQTRDLQALEQQSAAMKAETARANEELATVLKEKADRDARLKELRETYDAGAKQVHETQQSIQQARDEIKQLEKDLALRTSGLDAIRSQHAKETAARDELLAKRTDLEHQIAEAQAEIDRLNNEVSAVQQEHLAHRERIEKNEAHLQRLQAEAEQARWRKQQMDAEMQKLRERSAKVQQASDTASREAQEAAAAESKAAADLANQRATEPSPAGSEVTTKAATTAVAAAAGFGGGALAEKFTHLEPGSAGDAPLATSHANSVGSSEDFTHTHGESSGVPPSTSFGETPRTSPPTSETNYVAAADGSMMPSFTLPMDRPHSTTSSVVNNAPLSVRGDLGSETSERQSPELPPMPSDPISIPQPSTTATATAATTTQLASTVDDVEMQHPNDSFEFVDAQQSSDDEGPEDAIPKRYGPPSPNPMSAPPAAAEDRSEPSAPPPMPGAFPKEYEQPLSEITEPEQQPQQQQQQVPQTQPQQPPHQLQKSPIPHDENGMTAPPPAAMTSSSPVPPSVARVGASGSVVVPQASSQAAADEFDEFDDLEEAREDDSDVFGSGSFAATSAVNSAVPTGGSIGGAASALPTASDATGPDEWQQLFAGSEGRDVSSAADPFNYAAPPQNVGGGSGSQTSESREVAELTSMGFTVDEAKAALQLHGHNLSEATNYLLDRMQ